MFPHYLKKKLYDKKVICILKKKFKMKERKKIGEPPGSLIYAGERKKIKSQTVFIRYNKDEFVISESELEDNEVETFNLEKNKVNWINITGLANIKLIEKIGLSFDLHPLVLEDILNPSQRPKIEEFDKYIFIIIKKLLWEEKTAEFNQEQISLVLGPNFVLSFSEEESDLFKTIIDRIQIPKGRIRIMGADYLLYCLIDLIVDNYFIIMEFLNEKIENIEDTLVSNPEPSTLQEIYELKKTIIELRKLVWPLRELVNKLQRQKLELISDELQIYIRDIYDHIFRITETLDSFREIIFGMLDMYLSSVSNKMNEIMKVLTIISTTFIPLSFLAGFYGMNFIYMPELSFVLSYPILIIVMFSIFFIMIYFFRRRKWL